MGWLLNEGFVVDQQQTNKQKKREINLECVLSQINVV